MAKRDQDEPRRASVIQTLLKIDEALSQDLKREHLSTDTRNKSKARREQLKKERKEKMLRGEPLTEVKTYTTYNSWQDIAQYLEDASETEGIKYPVGRGTIYSYLKFFEEDLGVEFSLAHPRDAKGDCSETQKKNPQKVYRYPEGFKNYELKNYIESVLNAAGSTQDLKRYLDQFGDENSLSIWTNLFIKNLNRRQQLMNAVSFYDIDTFSNPQLFEDLLEYIIKKTPIRFYVKGSDKVTQEPVNKLVRMHPYLLKNYNRRWFLIGRVKDEHYPKENRYYEPFSPYALNQIVLNPVVDGEKQPTLSEWTGTTSKGLIYQIEFDDSTNTEEHMEAFKAAVGVTIQGDLQDVLLRFPKWRYDKYVSTKPLVGGDYQWGGQTSEDGKFVTVKIQTYITKELIQQILSFGPDCEVVSPASLREAVIGQYKEIIKMYNL